MEVWEKETLLNYLSIIGFDTEKHADVKEAMREIVKRDGYADVIAGKDTTGYLVEEVKEILEAYKYLKEIPNEEIFELIKERDEETEERLEDEESYEVVHLSRQNMPYTFMLKNKETGEYEELKKVDASSKSVGFNGYVHDDDKLYNVLGNVIIDNKEIIDEYKERIIGREINGNILRFYDRADHTTVFYISSDGKTYMYIDDSLYAKNIDFILKNNCLDIPYVKILGMMKKKKKYAFLNTWEVCEVKNNYIRARKGNDEAYYNIDGEAILDTINSDYVTLGPIYNPDNIIIVSKYAGDLTKRYGYYCLDTASVIEPPRNKNIYPWYIIGAFIDGNIPTCIVKEGNNFKRLAFPKISVSDINSPYYQSGDSQEFDNFIDYIPRGGEQVFPLVKTLQKIREGLYNVNNRLYIREDYGIDEEVKKDIQDGDKRVKISSFKCAFDIFSGYKNGKWSGLDYDANFSYYDKLGVIVDRAFNHKKLSKILYAINPIYIAAAYGDSGERVSHCRSLRLFDYEGEAYQHFFTLCDKIMNSENKDATTKENSSQTKLSIEKFSPTHKIESTRKHTSDTTSLSNQDNKVDKALLVLLESGLLTETQINELRLTGNKNNCEELAHIEKKEEPIGESFDYKSVHIHDIKGISEDGNIVWVSCTIGKADTITDIILDRVTKKRIHNPNYKILSLAANGNFTVERRENKDKKQYVLNSRKGPLIGPKEAIWGPTNGIYISVDDDGKYQAYDINGNEIIKKVDFLHWDTKYIVNSAGTVLKTEPVLKLSNMGYIYVIDSDGEKLISIPEENLELLEFLGDSQNKKSLKLNGTTK